jgi:Family of unknown function (DUF490).
VKYHATLSTIVISIAVVLIFFSVAVFTVFSLNILSPGFMVSDAVLKKLPSVEPYSLSYGSLDSSMGSSITINDISLSLHGEEFLTASRVRINAGLFALIKGWLGGEVPLDVTVYGLSVNVPFDYSEFTLPELFNKKDNGEGASSDKKRMNYSVKLRTDNASFVYQDLIRLSDLSFSTDLGRDFMPSNFRLALNSGRIIYEDYDLLLNDFRFQMSRNEGWILDFSVESISLDGEYRLNVENLRATAETADFLKEKLTADNLLDSSVSLSLSALDFDSELLKAASSELSVSYEAARLSTYFENLTLSNGDYAVRFDSAPLLLTVDREQQSLSFKTLRSGILKFSFRGRDSAVLNSLSFDLAKEAENYYLTVNTLSISALNLSSYVDFFNNFALDNFKIALRYSREQGIQLQGSLDAGLTSAFKTIPSVKFPLSFFVETDEDFHIKDASFDAEHVSVAGTGDTYDALFDIDEDSRMSLSLSNGSNFSVSCNISDDVSLSLEAFNFPVSPYRELIEFFFPQIKSYVGDNTAFTTRVQFDWNRSSRKGSLNSLLTLSEIRFNDFDFSVSTSVDAQIEDRIVDISRMIVSTDFVRLEYCGFINLSAFSPDGRLTISLPSSSVPLLSLSLNPEEDNSYSFKGTIPRFESGYLAGNVAYAENEIISSMNLAFKNRSYPINLDWNMDDKRINIDSDGLLINADYADLIIDILASFEKFPIGPVSDMGDTLVDGQFHFNFDIPAQSFSLNLPDFALGPFNFLKNSPMLYLSLSGDTENIVLRRFDFISDADSFTGRGEYDITGKRGAFTIGDGAESIDLTITPFGKLLTGIIDIRNLSLSRFGLSDQVLSGSLIGRGGKLDDLEFSGSFDISPSPLSVNPWNLSSSILCTKNKIDFSNISYRNGLFSLDGAELSYDTEEGALRASARFNLDINGNHEEHSIASAFNLYAPLGSYSNLYKAAKGIYNSYSTGTLSGIINIPYLSFDGDNLGTDLILNLEKTGPGLMLGGNMLSGQMDLETWRGDISIFGLDKFVNADINGILNPMDLDFDLTVNRFNLYYLNTVISNPVFKFLPDSIAYGKVKVLGALPGFDVHLYGDVSGYEIGMDVWWIRRQDLILEHPTFNIWNNVVNSANCPVLAVDRETREKKLVNATLELSLLQGSFMDYFRLDVYMDENNKAFVRVPLNGMNVDSEFWTYGHFLMEVDSSARLNLGGELYVSDGQLSYGLKELPSWWDSVKLVNNDFTFHFGKNLVVLFPLSSNPILRANLKSDTTVSLGYDMYNDNKMDVDGDILLQSGQIFYFQKNFFITEGSINLNQNGNVIDPKISLRARLRDFDTNNEKVDIYLVLNNATLNSLNPSFESSPQKSNSEIMSILGAAILPTDAQGERIENTVASLLTSGVDLLSRLGVVESQTGDLNESIRKALNLDMFTLNSRIFENFLLDSVKINNSGSQLQNTSALSRYLNNTSIYLGKNISDNFFLQGIIHFATVSDLMDEASLFASDLALNTEVSLEWTTPLGNVTFFTHPDSFTAYDMVRGLGVSYANRITF